MPDSIAYLDLDDNNPSKDLYRRLSEIVDLELLSTFYHLVNLAILSRILCNIFINIILPRSFVFAMESGPQ